MLSPRASFAQSRQHGFSLVEMMVALVAGMVVVGSVLAFTVAMANSTGKNVQATRLDQELRSSLSMISREVRRAGYYRKNYDTIGANSFVQSYAGVCLASGLTSCTTAPSTSTTTTSSAGCLVMSYDKWGVNDSGSTPGATEYRAFRRRVVSGVGIVEANLADNPPSCSGTGSNWLQLTNPATVNVSSLVFTYTPTQVQAATATDGTAVNVTVRTVDIALVGNVIGDTSVSRTFRETVRVRTDLVSNP